MESSDHDLLIRIDTKLGLLIEQFNDHKSDALKYIQDLKSTKLDKSLFIKFEEGYNNSKKDQEVRLRRLERYGAIAVGALSVIQIIISVSLS